MPPSNQPTDPGRAALNAHQYWLQFPVTVYFDTPVTVTGTLMDHLVVKTADGPMPRLVLQTDKGRRVIVNVSQERLRAELVRLEPAVMDRLSITYHGESDKAARGMSPAKQFTVEVTRPRPAQERTAPKEAGAENAPGPAGEPS